ncbi:ABC transporter substrate-binding protein [Verminephrobacter eiseniae]|uniref:ABC transporter substrate-binding protein n=1 Tax=Verminephrobacter eiseniae TaxID=364317 RepID=UPI0010E6FD5C|nr:ABC transporter substrate-binding protein [Verminephrobacter eiseniae]KAB7585092.1 ABC transporter substrate-binding protein [Verminephrobacter sp. Larva24]MCW5230202.1 ABC transporter substrate-binding protein [Verminephrobacter eiseniae]MCW5291935.1 ABC transporter substrate-binding protein [Verminephrobacter eiseniae]MCW8184912.1 ABC transporter substrate-binding protein [Verminephrobacter eiseniae]MCW8223660.1 ABC transporter substrate-binding protein [Verminephrobacter eiseniae]
MHLSSTSRLASLLMAGLISVAAMPAASQPIKLGIITDRVGAAKPYAEPVLQGAQVAAKEINASGGVLGRPIELLVEDDQGRPDLSATAARKLVDSGVAFILSISWTSATQQAQSVTVETGTPHLAPSNSGDTLTTQIANPNFWQTGPLASSQVSTLLAYARSKSFKRVAIIGDNTGLGQLMTQSFKAGIEAAKIQVVSEEVVPRGANSADAQIQRVRASNPDAIFLTGILAPENTLILRAYRLLGLKAPLLGNFSFSNIQYASIAKGLLDGLVFIDAFDPTKPQVQRFIATYTKAAGTAPDNINAYGYDGVMLVADAIRRAGGTDKLKVRDAMQATKGFVGVLGAQGASYGFANGKRTGFDGDGLVVRIYEGDRQGKVQFTGTR